MTRHGDMLRWPLVLPDGEAPDGRSLFYVANVRNLMEATLLPGASMGVTRRRIATRSPFLTPGASNRPASALSPDGKRFVGLSRVNLDAKLVVITNWLAELRRAQAAPTAR